MRSMLRLACLGVTFASAPAWSQGPATPPGKIQDDPEMAASQAVIRKLNAYVELLNRTLRASDSLTRYASWVNMKAGPTGRERIIYGLYSLYDVRGESAKALAATTQDPAMPELDASIRTYLAAYDALAPTIDKAEKYYERQDYKDDKMAEGRAMHAVLASAGPAFLAERSKVDALLARAKAASDEAELGLIDKREGRKARWHARNVMVRVRPVLDLLPNDARPVVDMAAFDAAVARYAGAVRDMDDYASANPGSFSSFESQPRSLLGKLRDFRDKLARAKGDARRGGGSDLTWIVSQYNMMASTSSMAMQFAR